MAMRCPWCSGRIVKRPMLYCIGTYHHVFKKAYGDVWEVEDAEVGVCNSCGAFSIFVDGKLVYPLKQCAQKKEFRDYEGRKIRLSAGRFRHIMKRHPEVANFFDEVSALLSQPDVVIGVDVPVKGVLLYHKALPKGDDDEQYLVAAVKISTGAKRSGYIRTIYLADELRPGIVVHRASY